MPSELMERTGTVPRQRNAASSAWPSGGCGGGCLENCWGSREWRDLSASPRSVVTRCDPSLPSKGSSPGSCSVGKIPPAGSARIGEPLPAPPDPLAPRDKAQRSPVGAFPRMWVQPGLGNGFLPASVTTLPPGAEILIPAPGYPTLPSPHSHQELKSSSQHRETHLSIPPHPTHLPERCQLSPGQGNPR